MRGQVMFKRGASIHYTWSELTIGSIAVFAILFTLALRLGNPHAMNQEYVAKDSATIIDALYGVPKDANVGITYPHRFDQYRFEARQGLVLVSNPRVISYATEYVVNPNIPNPLLDVSAKPHYPYMPHADYVPLQEDFLFVSLDFLKDRSGVHFSPTTDVLAGTIAVDDMDTAGTLETKRIFIAGKPEAQGIVSLLQSMVRIEAAKDATEENADMIIFVSTNAENVLRIYTADEDLLNAKRSKKLGQMVYNAFLKDAALFSSRELSLPATHLGDFAVFKYQVPTLLVEIGNGKSPATAYAEPMIVAVGEYYR